MSGWVAGKLGILLRGLIITIHSHPRSQQSVRHGQRERERESSANVRNVHEQQSTFISKQHIRAKMNGIQARELMRHDGRRVLSFILVWKVHMRTGHLT